MQKNQQESFQFFDGAQSQNEYTEYSKLNCKYSDFIQNILDIFTYIQTRSICKTYKNQLRRKRKAVIVYKL